MSDTTLSEMNSSSHQELGDGPHPSQNCHGQSHLLVKRMALAGIALGVVVAAFFVFPLDHILARMEGHVILVDEPVRTVVVPAESFTKLKFRLTNVTSSPVVVVGIESLCGCTSVEPIPLSIPASGEAELVVSFNMEGRLAGSIYQWNPRLFVDRPGPEVHLNVDISFE